MSNLIDKIKAFESLPEQTVSKFNEIFTDRPLKNQRANDEVVIGEIIGPVNVRNLLVGGKNIEHAFKIPLSDEMLYSANESNSDSDNLILNDKELEMDPFEYKLLQYFRGSQSKFHTHVEISKKLKKSLRGLGDAIKRMEQKSIITTEFVTRIGKTAVTINEDWN